MSDIVNSIIAIINYFSKNGKEPLIKLELETDSTGFSDFYLSNSGEGPATKIEIENKELECSCSDVTLSPKGKKAGDKFKPQFPEIAALAARESKKKINVLMDTEERGRVTLIRTYITNLPYSPGKEVNIIYKDSKGEGFFTLMAISREESKILKSGKLKMKIREKTKKWLSEKLSRLNKRSK